MTLSPLINVPSPNDELGFPIENGSWWMKKASIASTSLESLLDAESKTLLKLEPESVQMRNAPELKTWNAIYTLLPEESFAQATFRFASPPKPWLGPDIARKLEKMRHASLSEKEMVDLMDRIAKISVDFYRPKIGKCIALTFDGRIVESSDEETDLLLKIQGKHYEMPIFVWRVGSSSFTGWGS